ncbi:hypothetical protein MUK42_00111 [Musa troglodytarum]|uniref:Uncharacterized protein n=1 Tax=Musa troglodytarum TaxID=320322 RepID=A0A9E7FDP7_9LILI|nr:hypothetical protein MUK42_00111 [Musa troglodytarum]
METNDSKPALSIDRPIPIQLAERKDRDGRDEAREVELDSSRSKRSPSSAGSAQLIPLFLHSPSPCRYGFSSSFWLPRFGSTEIPLRSGFSISVFENCVSELASLDGFSTRSLRVESAFLISPRFRVFPVGDGVPACIAPSQAVGIEDMFNSL